MRFLTGLGLASAVLLAGCAGESSSPASDPPPPPAAAQPAPATTPEPQQPPATWGRSAARIVRAWSRAINSGDNDSAARLFARGAHVIQGAIVYVLQTRDDAVAWNAGLPCSGRIVRITTRGRTATAEFVLGDRRTSACDAPGAHAAAVFEIRRGKIVLWRQVPVPKSDTLTV